MIFREVLLSMKIDWMIVSEVPEGKVPGHIGVLVSDGINTTTSNTGLASLDEKHPLLSNSAVVWP